MPTLPTAEDVNKAGQQAAQALGGAVVQARTPLMAALGAGDLAAQGARDTLKRVRTQLGERAEAAKAGVNDLPTDLTGLREKLGPAELRKRVDGYTKLAVKYYSSLADRGEGAFDRLSTQPQFQRVISQLETAQERLNSAVGDARGLADGVLGKVSRSTRSFGEKAARTTEKVASDAADTVKETASDVADTVEETGSKTATATRRTTRKAANQTSAARTTAGRQTRSTASKSTEK